MPSGFNLSVYFSLSTVQSTCPKAGKGCKIKSLSEDEQIDACRQKQLTLHGRRSGWSQQFYPYSSETPRKEICEHISLTNHLCLEERPVKQTDTKPKHCQHRHIQCQSCLLLIIRVQLQIPNTNFQCFIVHIAVCIKHNTHMRKKDAGLFWKLSFWC